MRVPSAKVPRVPKKRQPAKPNSKGKARKASSNRSVSAGHHHGHAPGSGHAHRSYSQICRILERAKLVPEVRDRALQCFEALARAEARVHGTKVEEVHFHEVGALDSIVDIVGACIGFDELGIEKIYCSPLNLGSGTVKAAHGVMPVPAPATAALVEGVPSYSEGPAVELKYDNQGNRLGQSATYGVPAR